MKYEILMQFISLLKSDSSSRFRAHMEPFYDLQFQYGYAWLEIEDYQHLGRLQNARCKYIVKIPDYDRRRLFHPTAA